MAKKKKAKKQPKRSKPRATNSTGAEGSPVGRRRGELPAEVTEEWVLQQLPWLRSEEARQKHEQEERQHSRKLMAGPQGMMPEEYLCELAPADWVSRCDDFVYSFFDLGPATSLNQDTLSDLVNLADEISFRAAQLGIVSSNLKQLAVYADSCRGISSCTELDKEFYRLMPLAVAVVNEVRQRAMAEILPVKPPPEESKSSRPGHPPGREVDPAGPGGSEATPATDDADSCAHNPEFTWVRWFGEEYRFAKGQQARVVEELWKLWEENGKKDGVGISQETLGDAVGSAASRFEVRTVFRTGGQQHPAFGTMMRQVSKGVYGLYAPE